LPKSRKHGKNGLNKRELVFPREYIKDYNTSKAAIRAGYAKKTAYANGYKLLENVGIQRRILELESQLQNKTLISKEKILKELAIIGFSSIDEHLEIGENGLVQAKTFEEMPPGSVRCIKKIKEKRVIRTEKGTKEKPDGEEILDSTFEFELYDKPTALINMGKELGMFKDKGDSPQGEFTLKIVYDQKPQAQNGD
jgi:phage terminase small subunit